MEKVEEIAGALGVNDSKVRRRMSSKIAELLRGRAFDARNEISHELHLTHPSGDRRAALERRKRVRKYDEVREMAQECLDVTQLIINDASIRLAPEPDSVG
ncbi:hypothetical protein [Cellulosimicrobium funkei]|uniref:Uncharacterized protein n=1 Tax=Cellulosimicrobium funkei TaxID=264251 RepID=A0A4Y8QXC1_9MICO|nr:hypothetical protein [Cellulosimicrobium funkei]TFF04190.1 hypothetical protein E1O70_19060 [Cellulosimicrobium funkei]TGA67617.1 hypothetical protein EQW79_019055 [Cellulosimicrobium terreum]